MAYFKGITIDKGLEGIEDLNKRKALEKILSAATDQDLQVTYNVTESAVCCNKQGM